MLQVTIRLLLISACSISGYFIASKSIIFPFSLIGLLFGLFIALFVIQVEQGVRHVSLRVILGGVLGTLVGLVIAFLAAFALNFTSLEDRQAIVPWVHVLLTCALGYLGLVIGSRRGEEVTLIFGRTGEARVINDHRILDTSVIIDGRIADIGETGFLEGPLIVPRFVLEELQLIADSSDPMKRSRADGASMFSTACRKAPACASRYWIRTFRR